VAAGCELVPAYQDVMTIPTCSLQNRVEQLTSVDAVHREDLSWGDQVCVTTRNSVYSIWAMADGTYYVSGGWFDRRSLSPLKTTINGCTFGGSAIGHDIVAAAGLFLEFGNGVQTTRIQRVSVIRAEVDQPN
jgi:hypothetical protein